MKKTVLTLAILALLSSCGSENSQSKSLKSESFHVYGNCGMCEKTIEGSLEGVDGVSSADWNKETKQMKVSFDTTAINISEIKQKIAGVGYDMEDVRADKSTYKELPGCCQYDRPGEID